MVTVRPISFVEVRDAAPEMLAEYAAECSVPALGMPNPAWDIYALWNASGLHEGFGVYVDETFAGFASVLFTYLPHYDGVKLASIESLFVRKMYRRQSRAAGVLMNAVRQRAKERECKAIIYSARVGGALEALLERRSEFSDQRCTKINSVFCESL